MDKEYARTPSESEDGEPLSPEIRKKRKEISLFTMMREFNYSIKDI